ncbi:MULTISPECIES: hypothetical protein [unclassified Streptomyces]|uniref:hypothetical protein n=1 Tax=unclassified Streptomyces TaxID=2593676 RepID=UPI0033AE575D
MRLSIVVLAFMTAWKTLITHSAIPHPVGVTVSAKTAVHSAEPAVTAVGDDERAHVGGDQPTPTLSIPHHLEDLRVLRKNAHPSGRFNGLPDTGASDKCAAFTATALNFDPHEPFSAGPPATGPPPLILSALLRARLQSWRI